MNARFELYSNEKMEEYAESIIKNCADRGFTIMDMKDLAVLLPDLIEIQVCSSDEKTALVYSPWYSSEKANS